MLIMNVSVQASGFEDETLDGWKASNTNAIKVVSGIGTNDGKCVEMNRTTSNINLSKTMSVTEKTIDFCADIYSLTNSPRLVIYLYDGTLVMSRVEIRYGVFHHNPSTGNKEFDENSEFKEKTWYKLRIVLNTKTNKASYYINGKPAQLQADMYQKGSKLTQIKFDVQSEAVVYLDSISYGAVEKPTANNVSINGISQTGKTLTAKYEYSGSLSEGYTKFSWLISDNEDSDFVPIEGANGSSYAIREEDSNKFIRVQITPVDEIGTEGLSVQSNSTERIVYKEITPPAIENLKITGVAEAGKTLRASYDYISEVSEGKSVKNWLVSNEENGKFVAVGNNTDSITLTADDVGKYFKFEITPYDVNDIGGKTYTTSSSGAVSWQENYFDFSHADLSAWTLKNIPTNGSISVDEGVVKFERNSNGHISMEKKITAQKGIIALEFDLMTNDVAKSKLDCRFYGSKESGSPGDIAVQFMFIGGKITGNGNVLASDVKAGQWYRLKAVENTYTDTVSFYIDNKPVLEDIPFRDNAKLTNITKMWFEAQSNVQTVYMDNIRIYYPPMIERVEFYKNDTLIEDTLDIPVDFDYGEIVFNSFAQGGTVALLDYVTNKTIPLKLKETSDRRTYLFTIDSTLEYKSRYKLITEGFKNDEDVSVLPESMIFKTQEYPFYVSGYQFKALDTIYEMTESESYSCCVDLVNKTGQEKKVFAGMGLYSKDGQLKACTVIENASAETEINLKIDSVKGLKSDYLKVFIWDNSNNQKPIFNVKYLGQRPTSVNEWSGMHPKIGLTAKEFSNATVDFDTAQLLETSTLVGQYDVKEATEKLVKTSYVYRTTMQEEYLEKAQSLALDIISNTSWGGEEKNTNIVTGEVLYALTVTYDWLNGSMEASVKNAIKEKMISLMRAFEVSEAEGEFEKNFKFVYASSVYMAAVALFGEYDDAESYLLTTKEYIASDCERVMAYTQNTDVLYRAEAIISQKRIEAVDDVITGEDTSDINTVLGIRPIIYTHTTIQSTDKSIVKTYPNGYMKAATFSYDDGVVEDLELISIFDTYGVKGAFNLNSGRMNDAQGTRLKPDVAASAYDNHEVASHSLTHPDLTTLTYDEIMSQIVDDQSNIEKITGKAVKGVAYPLGKPTNDTRLLDIMRLSGIKYARGIGATKKFSLPTDFMRLTPSGHHKTESGLIDSFIEQTTDNEMLLLYIWGHAYEFDDDNNWELIESFCEKLSDQDDIWLATNIEIVEYVKAMRELEIKDNQIINSSPITLCVKVGEQLTEILPYSVVTLQ